MAHNRFIFFFELDRVCSGFGFVSGTWHLGSGVDLVPRVNIGSCSIGSARLGLIWERSTLKVLHYFIKNHLRM